MKIAAIVVIYEPSNEEMEAIINKLSLFDKIIVYDNSKTNHNNFFNGFEKCLYEYNGENDGLAVAYNFALRYCNENKYEWLFILDQDSSIDNNNTSILLSALNKVKGNIGIVCPYIKYNESDPLPGKNTEFIEWTINSGSVLNVQLLSLNNIKYDENYFLDRLDRDFCMQLTRAGLKIVRINKAILNQQLGENVNGRYLHSPLRNYYMARNRLYYNHKFYKLPKRTVYNLLQTIKHINGCILGNMDVKKNVKMIFEGIQDYRKGKLKKKEL